MNRKLLTLLAATLISFGVKAQVEDEYVQQGEFGFSVGGAHYFGDLNNRAAFNRPKPAAGIFFRKQFGNYIGLRVSGHFAQLGYSDTYSKNEFQRLRNLSFNTNIYEFAVQGDFNFFKFIPMDPAHSFTPYVTLGVGVFNYDPYAYYNGDKYYLRPLGTEGQTSGYKGRKEYGTMAMCIPFGAGLKYSLTPRTNISFEVAHRFTFTDYIDDVSSTYAGINNFQGGPNGTKSIAQLLQDRSYEIDNGHTVLGIEGRQRGFSKQKDQYLIAEIGISFNLSSYRCPTAN